MRLSCREGNLRTLETTSIKFKRFVYNSARYRQEQKLMFTKTSIRNIKRVILQEIAREDLKGRIPERGIRSDSAG